MLSVVIGPGSAIGDDFVAHAVPSLISFTGSTPIGKNIGKIATGSRHEKFVAHLRKLNVGNPGSMETTVGPIINRSQLEGLQQKIAKARKQGATVLLDGDIHGQVVPPHVFGDVTLDMELSSDEIFGPLVGIQKFRDEQHALELTDGTAFGLSSAVFCGDLARGLRFARKIKAGMAHVNDMPVNDEAHVPFGGEKDSGLGRFNGDWAIDEFSTVQWVSVQSDPRQYPF